MSDNGTNGYQFPFSGILTRFQTRVGYGPTALETIQMRTFHPGAANHATPIGQGSVQAINTVAPSTVQDLLDRVPAAEGDRLGARYTNESGSFLGVTHYSFGAAGGEQVSKDVADPLANGVDHDFAAPFATVRTNIRALLEPDADGDQFGDESQDLCIDDPAQSHAPCSGSAVDSVLPPSTSGGSLVSCSGFACIVVQRKLGGALQAAPFDGVIVRWRMRTVASTAVKLRVLRPVGSGQWTLMSSGDATTVPFDPIRNFAIHTYPARVPISAGDYVGFSKPATIGLASGGAFAAGANTLEEIAETPDGTTVSYDPSPSASEVAFGADIEPDADHDGYGDVTQDLCPVDATTHEPCSLASDVAAPLITQFKSLFKRFRVKPGGAVVSKRAHPGTTISLNLSEPSVVALTVTKLFRGKITKGECKKAGRSNRKGRRCTKTIVVHSFNRALATGTNTFPYSARYLDARGKIGTLRPGPYRMTAVATDYAGNAGPAANISFKIRR
jgi:hypothetical protein